MKSDMQRVSDSLLSGSGSDASLERGSGLNLLNFNTPVKNTLPANNAFNASIMYLIAAILAFLGELYLAFQLGVWQVYAVAGIGAILVCIAIISARLIRRGRPDVGVRLLIAASLVSVLVAPLLVAGFGLVLGLGTILVVITITLQTRPQSEANWTLMGSVGVALVAGWIDLLSPPSQLTLPAFQSLLLAIGGGMILVYGAVAIYQFRSYPLTTKLILAFLMVSLIPLGLLAFWNGRHIEAVLVEEARMSLFAAASQTADNLDNFLKDNLAAVRREAQLPALVRYLSLPAEAQASSAERKIIETTLRELSRKDKVFITSYGLLDSQGVNIIDINEADIGQDESRRDYFQRPQETGLPYVSPIQFFSSLSEDKSTLDNAALFFSYPIYSPDKEEILGVLRLRYRANILQKLIVQNNNLIGEKSFAVLFDENQIRLAHGADPDLVFKSVVPLETAQVTKLQAAGRLPEQLPADLSTDLRDLAQGLTETIFDPFFTTQLISTAGSTDLVAVQELDTQPWLVVFAQPQDVFLAPIEAQTRITLFLAIIIAGVVAAAAFVMGQLLASPLVELTKTVTRFTDGDLDARATLKSNDESGILAASFNAMADQVSKLLRNLAERTRELEAQISERQRAETELQASEKKYRTLFEDSKDVIFIADTEGRLVDINPAGVSLSGYSKAELLELSIQDQYVKREDLPRFLKTMEKHGSVKDFEVKFYRKDGSEADCLMTATTRQADDGTVIGYQGIIRDITALKQVEKERLRLLAIERELAIAHEIQESLLPPPKPNWRGPEVLAYTTSAREVGGDFYAYYAFNDNRFAITVGDVSGKGMPAALLMAVSLSSLQAIVPQNLAPGLLLRHLDHAIAPYTGATGQNCALVYVELIPPTINGEVGDEVKRGILRVANAGCIIPLIRRTDGSATWVDAFGFPLGMKLGSEFGYRELEVPVSEGDLVILTSDGLVEAMAATKEMFGFERLEQAVVTGPTTSAEAMLAHLRETVAAFVGQAEPHDDLTMVVLQVKGSSVNDQLAIRNDIPEVEAVTSRG